MWRIKNIDPLSYRLWWSNELGWTTDLANATTFTDEERYNLNLPIGGKWIKFQLLLT